MRSSIFLSLLTYMKKSPHSIFSTELIAAAYNGHTSELRKQLQTTPRCDTNLTDKYGNTALSWAVGNGHRDCSHLLLEYGADPNIPNSWGWTPLHKAADHLHIDLCEVLIKAGADWRKVTNGCTFEHGFRNKMPLALIRSKEKKYYLKKFILAEMYWKSRKSFLMFLYQHRMQGGSDDYSVVSLNKQNLYDVFFMPEMVRLVASYLGPCSSEIRQLEEAYNEIALLLR